MNFETAADSFIRPRIAPRAVPASAVLESRSGEVRSSESRGGESRGGESRGGIDGGEGEVSFDDLLDLVNPLHHLPAIGTLYRRLTGDTIGGPARILGGLLYGGPVGFAAAAANAIAEEAGGQSAGDAVFTAMFGPDDDPVAARAAPRDAPGPNLPPSPDAPPADTPPSEALAGEAALAAFLNDIGRAAQAKPPAPEKAPGDGRVPDRRETAAVPANLIGLGPRDRRGRAVPEPVPHVPPAPAKRPGRPTGGVDPRFPAPADPLAETTAFGRADFSGQMMRALRKYEDMLTARRAQGRP